MKKLLLAMTVLLTATSAQATSAQTTSAETTSFKLVAADNSHTSNLCVIAAEQGLRAAKKEARPLGQAYSEFAIRGSCNGMSVKNFVKSVQAKAVTAS